jgi:hypothetical protein
MPDRREILAGMGAILVAGVLPRALWAAGKVNVDDASALVVVDVQNCFLPGGSLAVKDGDQVVRVINKIAKGFANVVMTQDWHTAGHVSFASSHDGKKPFETVDLKYGRQMLWPDHCVQGTDGAGLSKDLSVPQVIRRPQPSRRPWPLQPEPGATRARRSCIPTARPGRWCRTAPTDRGLRTWLDVRWGRISRPRGRIS